MFPSSHPFPSQTIPRAPNPPDFCFPRLPQAPCSQPPCGVLGWRPTQLCELVWSHVPLVQALGPLLHLNLGWVAHWHCARVQSHTRAELRLTVRRRSGTTTPQSAGPASASHRLGGRGEVGGAEPRAAPMDPPSTHCPTLPPCRLALILP